MQTTLLIYMASDNNLSIYAEQDLQKIIKSSTSSDMMVVVQYNKNKFIDSLTTVRLAIKNGEILNDNELGDTNTGDPSILKSFIEESSKSYPANKTIVILWSHGSGIDDRDFYDNEKKRELYFIPKKEIEEIAFGFDDSYRDFLDNLELQKALDVSTKIDVLGFDACFMGMFEIVYQLKEKTEVMIASQHLEPASGWDYEQILQELDVEVSATEIGKQFIAFHNEYHQQNERAEVTQSALNTNEIESVSKKLDIFAKTLREELKKGDEIKNRKDLKITLDNTQNFGRSDYIDLVNFIEKVKNRLEFEKLEPFADELLYSLKAFVIANHSIGYFMDDANGISLYFPSQNRPFKETFEKYEELDFSIDYPNWVKLLKWYWL